MGDLGRPWREPVAEIGDFRLDEEEGVLARPAAPRPAEDGIRMGAGGPAEEEGNLVVAVTPVEEGTLAGAAEAGMGEVLISGSTGLINPSGGGPFKSSDIFVWGGSIGATGGIAADD